MSVRFSLSAAAAALHSPPAPPVLYTHLLSNVIIKSSQWYRVDAIWQYPTLVVTILYDFS